MRNRAYPRPSWASCRVLALLLLAGAPPARAVDLHLIARAYTGTRQDGGEDSEQTDQRYSFSLFQEISPWLTVRASFLYNAFDSRFDDGADFERTSEAPQIELSYFRPRFSGRFEYRERRNRSSVAVQNIDLESFLGQLQWRPSQGPRMTLRFSDQRNVADITVFGRDVDSQTLELEAAYNRALWDVRYSFQLLDLTNRLSGLELDQTRHELRGGAVKRFLNDRLDVSVTAQLSRVDETERVPQTGPPVRLLPASAGLFALDTSPEVGELDPSPQLVDGDLVSPAQPRVEIGGANTFRNVGVDLGVTRPISRLEIYVDGISDPGLLWSVYQSSDNLNWRLVGGVTSAFDVGLLRYTLSFPETAARYFKAVNVSANSLDQVAVTEVRALVETDELGRREDASTVYRATLAAGYNVSPRVAVTLSSSIRNEEDRTAGLASQELEELSVDAGSRILLSDNLSLRFAYRFSELEERLEPVLTREQEEISANLEWTPLPAVNVAAIASHREERDDGRLIRSTDSLRLSAFTELLPDLRLTSEAGWGQVDDPLFGFQQEYWEIRETLDSRPTPRWNLGGTAAYIRYDSTGSLRLSSRRRYELRTSYRVAPFVLLSGSWDYSKDDLQENLSQRYGLSWRPSRRVSASLVHQETETVDVRRTSTSSGSVSYRLNRHLTAWSNLSRSEFDQTGTDPRRTRTARVGINLFL